MKENSVISLGLTFDDVLLIPRYSGLKPEDAVITETNLCRGIKLKIPFISAAMDTVTGSNMAIVMARNGGIGIIHRNSSVGEQCKQVIHVKRHQSNMVTNPMTLTVDARLKDAIEIYKEFGFATIPIVDTEKKLLGLITERHLDDFNDPELFLTKIMVPFDQLVLAFKDTDLESASTILIKEGKKRLPIVVSKDDRTLVGIYFKKDIKNKENYPNMAIDKKGRLIVGAAIGVGSEGFDRAKALISAGVDVLCIDTAQGDSMGVVDILIKLKKEFPKTPIIAGNVVSKDAAMHLINNGADAIKVGVGPGAICTTREMTGNGMPQFSAILEVSKATRSRNIPLIADGGIKTPGDVAKALAAGANSVMMGSVFSGTDEAPGDILEQGSVKYKVYRGMGSKEAMQSGGGIANDRYLNSKLVKKIPEGISGLVAYKGTVQDVLDTYLGALVQSMRVYQGANNLDSLRNNAEFVQQTQLGQIESRTRI